MVERRRATGALGLGTLIGLGTLLSCSANGGDGSDPFGAGLAGNAGSDSNGGAGSLLSGGTGQGGSGALGFGGQQGGPGDSCASTSFDGNPVPLDMYVMLDRSGSMNFKEEGVTVAPWDAVKSALASFMQNPAAAGIGVGLQFFPPQNELLCPLLAPCPAGCTEIPDVFANRCEACDPMGFLPPAVGIQELPGAAGTLVTAMNAAVPDGDTPTMPALQSAGIATTNHAAANPDRKVVIVLATDGLPTRCETEIQPIANVAAAALASSPSVPTFIVGIGTETANLNAIAAAGGTGEAFILDGTTNVEQEFLQAMNEIRGAALGCEYLVPQPAANETPDPNKVNVVFTPDGAAPDTLPQVPNAGECKGQSGWYYTDPSNPRQLTLCPASCDVVEGSAGQIDIELGCATVIAPPR